ncbi:MAG: protein-S-isoprenylcysteine methyltransferase, partial [Blastomonas fulva]
MPSSAAPLHDPCPPSAVSHGAGLIGLVGLIGWVLLARHYAWNGPNAALVCCIATGLPMVLWSLLVDKVHLRPSTGLDWAHPSAVKDVIDASMIKLTGLWMTRAGIAAIYAV